MAFDLSDYAHYMHIADRLWRCAGFSESCYCLGYSLLFLRFR
jgi:hypothetical protein